MESFSNIFVDKGTFTWELQILIVRYKEREAHSFMYGSYDVPSYSLHHCGEGKLLASCHKFYYIILFYYMCVLSGQ
jgi:hypothetical protein